MTDRKLVHQALDMLKQAKDAVADWGAYASEYFQHKHNLQGSIDDIQTQITVLSERLAQPEQDWDWRHPKAQALIGAKARLEIKLRLVEQLVEDPNFETTASDMEYWEPLHDKLQGRLAQPEQPATYTCGVCGVSMQMEQRT